MDLTVANSDTRCYRWNGFGHEERDFVAADTRGRGQAFRARMGGNHSRRDGGCDCTDTVRGGPGTLAILATRGINKVKVAMVEGTSMNDHGEDLAVEKEVVDEDDSQVNGKLE